MFQYKNNSMKSQISILLISVFIFLSVSLEGQTPTGTSSLQTTDSLSLKSIISEIIKMHPTVKGAEEALNAADARIGLARTGYYPNIDATAAYSNIGPVVTISIPNLGSFQLYPQNNYSAAVNFKQTVFDFGRTRQSIDLENENKAYGELAVEQVKQKMSMAAINNFYSIAFLQDAIVIKNQELENLKAHLKYVETKKSTGSATDYEILTTQVRISTVESQKVDLQTSLKVQQSYLNSLLGLPENNSPTVRKELSAIEPEMNPDSLLSFAYKNRDEMLMSKKKISIASMRYDLTKTMNRPYLGFQASGGAKNGYLPNLEQARMNYAVGVGFTVPIFDAGRTKYNLQQAQVAINSLNYENESTRRSISSDVTQAQAYVMSAGQKVKQYELQLTQAEKAYSLAEISFKAGTITNLDLLDSSNQVSQSMLLLLKARIDFVAGIYTLKAALGERLY